MMHMPHTNTLTAKSPILDSDVVPATTTPAASCRSLDAGVGAQEDLTGVGERTNTTADSELTQ